MANQLPEQHPLNLGQKIIDFLQTKELYKEHIIDEVIKNYDKNAIVNAIYELSVMDLVNFPNNDPANSTSFLDFGESSEPATITYPVFAKLLEK